MYNEIYTINVLKYDTCISTLYALLSDKKTFYVFTFIKNI